MKTIKIMIAASEEMHEEKLEFSNLIEHLNEVLAVRGIELKRVKWDSDEERTTEEYLSKLGDCEMCLTLYWKELVGNTEKELDTAYQKQKDGENPRKLYVFFKEPAEDLSDALKDFKSNFVTNYGHFFCKFENVDTMNLQFLLQFEAYQSSVQDKQDKFIAIKDGKVLAGGKEFVTLGNVPFAAMNKEYQRLQSELVELESQADKARKRHISNPDDETLEEEYFAVKNKCMEKAKEFEQHQVYLYDIALNFAKLTGNQWSERLRKAKELFESGDTIGADQILNMAEMKRETEKEIEQYEQNRKNLELRIDEFHLKVDTVMANNMKTMQERFTEACDAYKQALSVAYVICHDEKKLSVILFGYAYLLQNFNRMYEAVKVYNQALEIYRNLAKAHPNAYKPKVFVALTLNNLAVLQSDLCHFEEAKTCYIEVLEIYRNLAKTDPDKYQTKLAMTLNNFALLQRNLGRYDEAEAGYIESLEIRMRLFKANPKDYMSDVAGTLLNLAILQSDLGRYEEAETNCGKALGFYRCLAEAHPEEYKPYVVRALNNLAVLQRNLERYEKAECGFREALDICRNLANSNPDAYLSDLAFTLNSFAILQSEIGCYDEAEANFNEALEIRRSLAKTIPDAYLPKVATTLHNLALLQSDLGRYEESEINYSEALEIFRNLASDNPDAYMHDLATTMDNLALLKSSQNLMDDSKELLSEALIIYELLEERAPGMYADKIESIKAFLY